MSGGQKLSQVEYKYLVNIEGTKFKEKDREISDVIVESVIDGADRFAITLNYKFDRKNKKFKKFSPGKFKAGKSITIKMGWDKKHPPSHKMFVGTIQNMQTEFGQGRGPTVGISGYGLLHDMMRGTPDDSWEKSKSSMVKLKDVVSSKLGDYFGKKEIKQAKLKRKKIIQHDESDYLFVKRLANKYGYQFYTERDKVFFIPRQDLGSKSPVLSKPLNHDRLESLTGEINEADEVKEVNVRFWDMNKEKEVVGKAKKSKAKNGKKKVYRIPCESKKEADEMAKHKLNRLSKARAEIHAETSKGQPKILPNETVKIEKVGKKFSKKYYVTKATHRISDSGFRTSFEGKEVV